MSVKRERINIKSEIAIIPVWAFVVAAIILVSVPILFLTLVFAGQPGEQPPAFYLQVLIAMIPATIFAFIVLMVGYVNRDAGRRGMSRTLWTIVAIAVPNGIGFILYFILRNPIRTQCPKCGTGVDRGFNYCPKCRYNFHPTCPQCKSAVSLVDCFCPHCGVQLNEVVA